MQNIGFTPSGQLTIAAVNNTSVRGTLPTSINQDKQIEVTNPTNGTIFALLGGAAVVASATTGYPIPAGKERRISMQGAETHIAVFLASGATDGPVYVTRGEGT